MVDTKTRRLTRSTTDRRVAGVAGGIGAYLGIDPVVVRIAFVVLTLAGGSGLLVYVVAWVLLPEDDDVTSVSGDRVPLEPRIALGAVLVVIGVLALGGGRWWFGDLGLPLLLVGGGAWLLLRRDDEPLPWFSSTSRPTPSTGDAPTPSSASTEEAAGTTAGLGPDDDATAVDPTVSLVPPLTGSGWHPPIPPIPPAGSIAASWSDRRRRRAIPSGPPTGRITIGLLVVLAGIAGLTNGADLPVRSWLLAASALATLGLLVGAFTGRARQLIGINTLLVLALVVEANGSIPIHGGIGERVHRPDQISELESRYEHGMGRFVVDLRDLDESDFPARTGLEISLGVGEVDLWVPDGVRVVVEASAVAGNVRVFDQEQDGTDVEVRDDHPAEEGSPRLDVKIEVGFGEVDVR